MDQGDNEARSRLPLPDVSVAGLFVGCGAFTAQSQASAGRSAGLGQRHVPGHAEVAERHGLDSFWLGEHHFATDGYTSAVFPLLGAVAARTERLVLGTRVVLAPLHPALLLAEQAAQVALLAAGRFILGLGLGYRDEEFRALRVPKRERVARLVEAVEVCRKAWTGQPFSHEGPTVSASGLVCRPAPPVPPRIWLGGRAAAAVARAAALGDGFVAPLGGPESTAAAVAQLDACTPAPRRPLGVVTSRLAVVVEPGRGDGGRLAGLGSVLSTYAAWKQADGGVNSATVAELERGVVRGTPAELAAALVPPCRALAGREHHLVVRLDYPGMDRSDVENHVRTFAREVAPRLREAVAVPG